MITTLGVIILIVVGVFAGWLSANREVRMMILGVILIIVGVFAGWISVPATIDPFSVDPWSTTNPIVWGIGIGVVVIGIVLAVLGRLGHRVGGPPRRASRHAE